jgi:cytochrome P450
MVGLCRVSALVPWPVISLTLCRMESLRVMPPAPVVNRTAQQEGELDGIFIPKGTMLYIPVSMSQRLALPF